MGTKTTNPHSPVHFYKVGKKNIGTACNFFNSARAVAAREQEATAAALCRWAAGVRLTYVQLWRQRFLGEPEQFSPIYVVGPKFVH